jgi:hypothetical protein
VRIVCGQAPVVNNAEESPLHDETAKPKAKKAKYVSKESKRSVKLD